MALRSLMISLFGVAMATSAALGASYVPGTEDVPLMPGLKTANNTGLVFDEPQGRIVEVTAEGPLQRAAVLDFYQMNLPPLGWKAAGSQKFERDGESLSLEIAGTDGDLTVSFALSPL